MKSRFLFYPGLCILFFCLLSCSSSGSGESNRGAPNIILIVADDLGWKDLGFMGSDYYETPRLDQLASEAMVFQQAYAAAANCAPSRACLMTGRYTPSHGIYTVGDSDRGDRRVRRMIPALNRDSLDPAFLTLAEVLKEAGYQTASMGKWHLGKDPRSQGFDLNVGGGPWGHPKRYFAPYDIPPLVAEEGEYLTDRLTREALDFIRQKEASPFFLYLPYYAIHTPIQPKQDLKEKYERKSASGCQSHAAYAAMVENLDRCVGLILDELDQLDLAKETLVIFTSDNGGIRSLSCQDPLRAGKGSYYEGGIRVPLLFRWPGKIEGGRVSEEPVILLDIYPTLLDMLGMENRTELDGISLWPHLKGQDRLASRPLFFHFPVYLQAYDPLSDGGRDPLFRTRPGSVIRFGNWKLHVYYEDKGVELYHLGDDLGERNNLAGINSNKTAELIDLLKTWLEENNAPVNFLPNPDFDEAYEKQVLRDIQAEGRSR